MKLRNILSTNSDIILEDGMLRSYKTSGPPMEIRSTGWVENLNVDMVDGKHASDFSLVNHTHTLNEILSNGYSAYGSIILNAPDFVTDPFARSVFVANHGGYETFGSSVEIGAEDYYSWLSFSHNADGSLNRTWRLTYTGENYVEVDAGGQIRVFGDPIHDNDLARKKYVDDKVATIPITTPSALTKTNDTNVTLTLGGTPNTALLQPVSLTLGWTGTLSVSRGGTGASTLTGVLIGNGTSAFTGVVGTANQLLRRNSGNTAYEFFTPTYISGNQTITLSGDVTGSGATSIATTISNGAVTLTKMANLPANTIIGNNTGVSATPIALTVAQVNAMLGSTFGTVTSVNMTVPTGFSVSGVPFTTSGTIALSYSSGYTGYTTAEQTKLAGIATGANNYVLPTATSTILGGVKLFNDTVQSVVSNAVTNTASRTYGAQLNSSGQLVVNIPWTDTTYTGSTSITLSGGSFQRAALTGDVTSPVNSNVLTLATVNTNVGTFGGGGNVPVITVNGKGLITAVTVQQETDPTVPSHVKSITTTDITNWNSKQSAITMSSSRLLGRYSAGTGVPQEISIGTGLSLSNVGVISFDTVFGDGRYVNADGDTITGQLFMSGSGIQITPNPTGKTYLSFINPSGTGTGYIDSFIVQSTNNTVQWYGSDGTVSGNLDLGFDVVSIKGKPIATQEWVTTQVPSNYVTTNTSQSGISGTKGWTGAHYWSHSAIFTPTVDNSSTNGSISIGRSVGALGPYVVGRDDTSLGFILRTYDVSGTQLSLYKGGIDLTLNGSGITLAGDARVYKRVGGGLVLKRSSDAYDVTIGNAANTEFYRIFSENWGLIKGFTQSWQMGAGNDVSTIGLNSGFYYANTTTATDLPSNSNSYIIHVSHNNNSTYALQLGATGVSGDKLYMRKNVAGTWSNWQPFATESWADAKFSTISSISGSAGYIPKFSGTSSINSSLIYQSGTGNIGIGTTNPTNKLEVRDTNDVSFYIVKTGISGVSIRAHSDFSGIEIFGTDTPFRLKVDSNIVLRADSTGLLTSAIHGTSANWWSSFSWGNHALAGYASASNVVNTTGNQTGINGVKYWTDSQSWRPASEPTPTANSVQVGFSTGNGIYLVGRDGSAANNFVIRGYVTSGIQMTLNLGGISTPSHGDSSQWNQAYNWGNHSTAGYVPSSRTLQFSSLSSTGLSITGTSLTDLSGNRTVNFTLNFGTGSGQIAQGNDSRINNGQTAFSWGNHASAGYVPQTRSFTFSAGSGLSVSGTSSTNLSVDRNVTYSIVFGSGSGQVAQGNDSRINNGQTAYSWGNHASMGYATGGPFVPTNRQLSFQTSTPGALNISGTSTTYLDQDRNVNYSINFGTGSGQVAEGNHNHHINNLSGVSISSPSNGQYLKYDSSTGNWYNGNIDSGASPNPYTTIRGAYTSEWNSVTKPYDSYGAIAINRDEGGFMWWDGVNTPIIKFSGGKYKGWTGSTWVDFH